MNNREVMDAVLDRANQLERQKQMKTIKVATAITACCSLLVVIGLSMAMSLWIANITLVAGESSSVVGSMVANSNMLGYVVVGMISFVIGIGITSMFYMWYQKIQGTERF